MLKRRINEDYEYIKKRIEFSDFDEENIEEFLSYIRGLRRKQNIKAKKSDYEDVAACDFVEGADAVIDVLESLLSDDFDSIDEFVDALDWCERQAGSSYEAEVLNVRNVVNSILKPGKRLESRRYRSFQF